MTQSDSDVEAPDGVPPYLEDSLRKFAGDQEALAAVRDFAAMLLDESMAPSADEVRATNTDGKVVEVSGDDGTVVKKKVTCGDETCKCRSGTEADMHGPYVYLVTRDGDGGTSWEYVGPATDDDPAEASA